MADRKTQDHGQHDGSGDPAVQKSVVRKGKHCEKHTAKNIGAFPRKPIGENAKKRNGEEFDRGSHAHRSEHQPLLDVEYNLAIGEDISAEKIKTRILTEAGPGHKQNFTPMTADRLSDRCAGQLVLLFELSKERRFEDSYPDQQADHDQQTAEIERHAPAPGKEFGVGDTGAAKLQHPR